MGEFQKTYEYLGRKGERVLGAAYFDLGQDRTKYNPTLKNYPTTNLCFTGLFALMDPPKKGVAEAVSAAHRAGKDFFKFLYFEILIFNFGLKK